MRDIRDPGIIRNKRIKIQDKQRNKSKLNERDKENKV
jgi:hypothetical protein